MRAQTITIIQDLHIFAVEPRDDGLRVDLVGPDGAVGSIVYDLPGGEALREHVRTLQAWAGADAPVTYVATGGSCGLIDERALFERALGGDLSVPQP